MLSKLLYDITRKTGKAASLLHDAELLAKGEIGKLVEKKVKNGVKKKVNKEINKL